MTRHFSPQSAAVAILPADLLVEAARCWREARDLGQPLQPCLFKILSGHDCGMLAPALDSVLTLWEAALGRGLSVGEPDGRSGDEDMLLGLLNGSRQWRPNAGNADGMASALDCALCSARIMMGREMAIQSPAPGH